MSSISWAANVSQSPSKSKAGNVSVVFSISSINNV